MYAPNQIVYDIKQQCLSHAYQYRGQKSTHLIWSIKAYKELPKDVIYNFFFNQKKKKIYCRHDGIYTAHEGNWFEQTPKQRYKLLSRRMRQGYVVPAATSPKDEHYRNILSAKSWYINRLKKIFNPLMIKINFNYFIIKGFKLFVLNQTSQ